MTCSTSSSSRLRGPFSVALAHSSASPARRRVSPSLVPARFPSWEIAPTVPPDDEGRDTRQELMGRPEAATSRSSRRAWLAGTGIALVLGLVLLVVWGPSACRLVQRHGNLAARDGCGIGGAAFSSPSTVGGDGVVRWMETEHRYRFEGKAEGWVDRNVLARFGDSPPVSELSPITQPEERVVGNTRWGAPERRTEDGGRLVYQSEFAENGVNGATTFDIYRDPGRPTRYTVVVECYGGAGVHGILQDHAATTTVP